MILQEMNRLQWASKLDTGAQAAAVFLAAPGTLKRYVVYTMIAASDVAGERSLEDDATSEIIHINVGADDTQQIWRRVVFPVNSGIKYNTSGVGKHTLTIGYIVEPVSGHAGSPAES